MGGYTLCDVLSRLPLNLISLLYPLHNVAHASGFFLSHPQGTVVVIVTTDDPTLGMIQYPNTLYFSSRTWNLPQNLVVRGVPSETLSSDSDYNVVFWVDTALTTDPYYKKNVNATYTLTQTARKS